MSDIIEKKISNLSSNKKALLEKWKNATLDNKKYIINLRKKGKNVLPMSFAQERLWYLEQLLPNTPIYSMPIGLRFNGFIDNKLLEESFKEVIKRHEILRTVFKIENGKRSQIVLEKVDFCLEFINLVKERRLTNSLLEEKIFDLISVPFNLEIGPLIRAFLIQLKNTEFILIINIHHIISDGWSLNILLKEVSTFYNRFVEKKDVFLADLSVQYGDFVLWQRNYLKEENLEKHLNYWKKKLSGNLPELQMSTDFRRPTFPLYQGKRYYFKLSKELTSQLKDLSLQQDVTLFTLLITAFKVLLNRYTGQEDIIVGSPVANRLNPHIEDLIGFFVNILALRTDLSGNPTFLELLQKEKIINLEAYDHQELPFEEIIKNLQPDRDLSNSPIFRVVFVLQNTPVSSITFSNFKPEIINVHNRTTKFDLLLSLFESEDGLKGFWEYDSQLFFPETIGRISKHFINLLEGIIINYRSKIEELQILTLNEQKDLYRTWSPKQNYDVVSCIHEMFEQQVRTNPDNIAVVFNNEKLTYSELDKISNKLANFLMKLGIKQNSMVGLATEISLETVIGILGILKAGAAYLPLDINYPEDRIKFMMDDSQIETVLTQQIFLDKFLNCNTKIVCLDLEWSRISKHSDLRPEIIVNPDNTMYVIYTSGSTGKPKGVLVKHANVVRLFLATEKFFNFNKNDVWTFFHSYSFDFSIWELWGALLYGGKIILVQQEVRYSPSLFYDLLIREKVTVLNQTPSSFRQLIKLEQLNGKASSDLNLRYIIFGGEALNFNHLRPWFELHGDTCPELVNMYGITETTVHVTLRKLSKKDLDAVNGSIIGVPISDLGVYILDKNLRPVPIGIIGEMYVGGAGVASGYLRRKELTEQKFINAPEIWKSSPLYKTGDLARYLNNGELEFLGRIDHQVKVRGFRIELEEIESCLYKNSAVEEVVVVDKEDIQENKLLIAYVVPKKQFIELNLKNIYFQNEQISQWQIVFNDYYEANQEKVDLEFNTSGWISSYTSESIQDIEMQEWVKNTVDRILLLSPKRVLEVGCGTGLLLSKIAPHCSVYVATDFSKTSVKCIQDLMKNHSHLSHVNLYHCEANNINHVQENEFDCIILNSIIQYFPSVNYLINVLKDLILKMKPGGCIFLGDIKDLRLQEVFHVSVEYSKTSIKSNIEYLRNMVQMRLFNDNELYLDPTFFHYLKSVIPEITHVEIQNKKGTYRNEMNKFRYDVVLYINSNKEDYIIERWIEWQNFDKNFSDMFRFKEKIIGVSNIPDARIIKDIYLTNALKETQPASLISELNNAHLCENNAVDPNQLWNYETKNHCKVLITPSLEKLGYFNAIFLLDEYSNNLPEIIITSKKFNLSNSEKIEDYANQPMQAKYFKKLIPELRLHLEKYLPDYMLPNIFVILDKIPITNNGKIDKKALPIPDYKSRLSPIDYMPASTPTEKLLVQAFVEVLGVQKVGKKDNFFELGGHSLLATQLIFNLRKTFNMDIPLRVILQASTVEKMAEVIDSIKTKRIDYDASQLLPVVDLNKEVKLNQDIQIPSLVSNYQSPKNVFLTGANGFFGTFLLYQLLELTSANVFCLIRAKNSTEGYQRLKQQMKYSLLWKENYLERIQVLIGDLSVPNFGLNEQQFNHLAQKVDAIYHNGAMVNFIYPYEALKAANVIGTEEVLKLAINSKLKAVHYISTLYVFSKQDSDKFKAIHEYDEPCYWQGLNLGYTQTKWVAERLVMLAKKQGVPASIYRLGRISGDSKHGYCQTSDFLWRIIKSCIQLGSSPELNLDVDIIPVDYASEAVVKISLQKDTSENVFHLHNSCPIPFYLLIQWIKEYGYSISQQDYTTWKKNIENDSGRSKNSIYSLLPVVSQMETTNQLNFDSKHTFEILRGLNLNCPSIDKNMVKIYLDFFIKIGFLAHNEYGS